jgi:UDP-N-acetyl-D-glucosamine dehydrogenase
MAVRVAIIGQGYVGTAVGVAAHAAGHEVFGIEIDPAKLNVLRDSVGYQVGSDYKLVDGAEIVVIAVPTPLNEKREPDLSFVESACHSLKKVLSGSVLVVNESTSFPGTLRNVIAPILGEVHLYASAPERVDPANEKWGIANTPRLVAGLNTTATQKAIEFYTSFCDQVIEVSSPEVAEAAKLFENTFRQVNIALVNEFAQIAQALDVPTVETLQAAATKPYGFMPFTPSIGVGGHCIPVDPSYLSYAAETAGVEAAFINLANKVNAGMPEYVASRIAALLGGSVAGKRIQIAGISYKADVPDTRESPALALIGVLREMGAVVDWHDEVVKSYGSEASKPLAAVDLGVIATAHSGVDYGPWKNGGVMVIDVSTSPNTGWPKFL